MWGLDDRTPFAAERTWLRDSRGRHHWLVAVKATYDIQPDASLSLSAEQRPPLHEPEYFGEPGESSIRYEADLVPVKPTTDVLVNGSAHAPDDEPSKSVTVGLKVGSVFKTLVVHGDRVFYVGPLGLSTSAPEKFLSKAIRYEAAYGGTGNKRLDPRNPIGRGFASKWSDLEGTLAPNVEYPSGDRAKRGPAGFGAIASYWEPRLGLAGTYDEKWERMSKPLLPADYDPRHVLCAPADQRPETHLVGGETLQLVGMSPRGVLSLTIPSVSLRLQTRVGRKRRAHEANLSTVLVEPDDSRLILCWQSSIEVGPQDVEYLDMTVIESESEDET